MTEQRGWRTTSSQRSGVVHVVPIGDIVDHPLEENCTCGPTCEIIPNEFGPDGYMWTHHSLDGRELDE